MDPQGDNAASRTLPLGTTAKVTNVETGKTAVVTIEDRGPYVDGRLVDLSPATAAEIGITPKKGIAKVVVAPIAVPQPDGKVKEGAAAHEPVGEPDHVPVHEDRALKGEKTAHVEKVARGEDEKAAHGDEAHAGKLAKAEEEKPSRAEKKAAAKATKLAAVESGDPAK